MDLEKRVTELEDTIGKLLIENQKLRKNQPKEKTYLEALESFVLDYPLISLSRMVSDSKYMKFTSEEIEKLRNDERQEVIRGMKRRLKDFEKQHGDRKLNEQE